MPKNRPVLKLKSKEERRNNRGGNKKNLTRWKKGHSCESNPDVRKFRDGASNLHFQLHSIGNNPLLTPGVLGSRQDDDMEDEYDVLSEDVQSLTVSDARTRLGSFSSCKTFASGWSKCSNGAFQRFLGRFKVDSALHKEMLSILAATTEVINSMGGKQSETEYFATFMSTLENCQPDQYHPMLALVCMILGKVSESVIRLKFKEIYPKLASILAYAMEHNENTLIRLCCEALGKTLRTQDGLVPDPGKSEESYTTYYLILRCCLHDNPKVRRKSRQVIGGLLHRLNEKGSLNLAKLVLSWILDQLVSYPTCGPKAACDVVGLLQFIWTFVESINTSFSKKVFESALRVMSGGDASILKIGFALFSNVFQKGHGLVSEKPTEQESNNNGSLTPKLVSVLLDLRPDWRNNEAFLGWVKCILDGIVRLLGEENGNGRKYIPLLIEAISPSWPSTFGTATALLVSQYMQHVVDASATEEAILENIFTVLSKNLIAIPPNPNCLLVLESYLTTLTPSNFGEISKQVFLQLVPLYRTNTSEVAVTLGCFVKSFGVENLWNSVDIQERRFVILPLLRENLSQGQFSFWKNNILSMLTAKDDPSPESTAIVVWDSFVGFCRDPSDPDCFPAETVGKIISTKPQVRLSALTGLRQFGLWSQAQAVLKKYTKNFIPLLFNLYVKEAAKSGKKEDGTTTDVNRGHAEAIILTVNEYLQFCDEEFLKDLLHRALDKLTTDNDAAEEERPPLIDLLATIVDHRIDDESLGKLINISSKLVNDLQQQKRGYRLLNAMVKNQTYEQEELVRTKVLNLLRTTKGKTKSNAEALRLECITYILGKDPDLVDEFLPEAVLNLLSVNMKVRKLASRFAVEACSLLKTVEKVLGVMEIGLKSTNAFVRACTINFMSLVFLHLKPKQPNGELINACISQIKNSKVGATHTNEVPEVSRSKCVTTADSTLTCKESLAFLSLNLSLFKSLMGPYAGAIGEVLALPGNPRKEVNKILARMIKVFGVAGLKAVLPTSNEPKMHTRIKNLQKKIRKLKEAKIKSGDSGRLDAGDDDKGGNAVSDESSDDDDNDDQIISRLTSTGGITSKRTLSKRGLIIKEGVVDFLDPTDVTGALISKPKEPKVGEQFKTSEDGKLIIEMEDEMSKTAGGKKRKRSRGAGGSDDGNDDEDDEYLETATMRSSAKSSRTAKSSASYGSHRSKKSSKSYHSAKSGAGGRKAGRGGKGKSKKARL